jgi:hypothetical protein
MLALVQSTLRFAADDSITGVIVGSAAHQKKLQSTPEWDSPDFLARL